MPLKDKAKIREAAKKYRADHPEKQRLYYLENRDKLLADASAYYSINRDKVLQSKRNTNSRYIALKNRCKRRNQDFRLSLEFYEQIVALPCYYCANQLGKQSAVGCGLDRVNNKLGYIESNCVSCCGVCNKIKNNFLSSGQTKAAVDAIIEYNKSHEK